MKNRLALLFFAVLIAVSPVHAQRRRPSAPPVPPADDGCSQKALFFDSFSADVEVDDQYLYFTDSANGIFRMPKTGGTPELLAMVPDNFITVLTLDDTTVYALTTNDDLTLGSVWSVAKTGGTPKELATNLLTPYEIAVDANAVYWVSVGTPSGLGFRADGKLEKVLKDGTGHIVLASNLNVPTSVASDGTKVYFCETGLSLDSSSSGLRSIPVNGGSITKLTTGTPVVALTLSPTDVYYSSLNLGSGTGELLRIPKSGGSSTSLVKGLDVVVQIAISGDRLYFFNTDDAQSIEWIPLAGGSRTRVLGGAFASEEFAVDGCAVFSVDANGVLQRTPK